MNLPASLYAINLINLFTSLLLKLICIRCSTGVYFPPPIPFLSLPFPFFRAWRGWTFYSILFLCFLQPFQSSSLLASLSHPFLAIGVVDMNPILDQIWILWLEIWGIFTTYFSEFLLRISLLFCVLAMKSFTVDSLFDFPIPPWKSKVFLCIPTRILLRKKKMEKREERHENSLWIKRHTTTLLCMILKTCIHPPPPFGGGHGGKSTCITMRSMKERKDDKYRYQHQWWNCNVID